MTHLFGQKARPLMFLLLTIVLMSEVRKKMETG